MSGAVASAPSETTGTRLRLGIALTAMAALFYGALPSMVRLAYAGGADETAVMLFRSGCAAAMSVVLAKATGRALLPPRDMRWMGLLMGAVWLVGAYSYIASFRRIPVGLAVTIFYMFPLMVAVMARAIEGERLSAKRILGLAVGFSGVVLAVGASIGGVEPVGVGLACIAALGVATNITASARVMRRSSPYAAMVMMTGGSFLALAALAPFIGLQLPVTPLGWFGLLASAVGVCAAMLCFYNAVDLIGGVRASMVCNLEPLAAIGFAFAVLGEALAPLQLLGVALVIGAILLVQLGGHSGKPQNP